MKIVNDYFKDIYRFMTCLTRKSTSIRWHSL